MEGNRKLLKYVVFLATIISVWGNADNLPYATKIVEGIYAKEVDGSVVYDTVVPLVYEFEVPSWTRDDTIIQRSQNCTNTNFTSSSTCPVLYYLPEMQTRFSTYLEMSNPFGSLFDSLEIGKGGHIEFNCDEIASHFNGNLFYSKGTTDEYLEALTRCPIKQFTKIPLQNYNYNISDIYLEMRAGFYKHYWMKINDGILDAAIWSNAIKVMNALIFNNYYMESNRWKLAVSDCRAGRIPSTLIGVDVLVGSLNDSFNAASEKYMPSLHLRDLAEYYTTPLTDCTFTDKSTFIVRILIPMKSRSSTTYTLYKLNTDSFVQYDESENTTFICEIRKSNNYVLVDQLQKIAYGTDCTGKGLCKSPGWINGGKVDSCASAVIASSYKGIVRYCDLHCEEMSPWQFAPVARPIDTDKFVLAMNPHSSATTLLRCPGSKDRNLRSVDIGAVQIKLPCSCKIHSNSDVIKINSCDAAAASADPYVYHTVPLHWINEKRLDYLDANKPTDMAFRRSGLVIRTTTKKYANIIDTNSIRADKVSGSGNHDNSSGSSSGVLLVFSYLFIFMLAGTVVFLFVRIKKLQNISGYSGQPVTYVHANAPLLANEEAENYYPNGNRF